MTHETVALIVAGGISARVGHVVPKPYIKVGGRAILDLILSEFLSHPLIDRVKVVIHRDHSPFYKEVIDAIRPMDILFDKLLEPAYGGEYRQDSVSCPRKVLIHDGCRPFVDREIISDVVHELDRGAQAVDVGISIPDTIKRRGDVDVEVLDRSRLYATQTPQGFDFRTIIALHQAMSNGRHFTDDISLCIESGVGVMVIDGSRYNIKITEREDLVYAEYLLGKVPQKG